MQLDMVKDGHLGGYIRGGDPATWCPELWKYLVDRFGIRSVLDIGCGEGHSTKFFKELGCEVLGVDGCQQAIEESAIPDHVMLHDFCDGPLDVGRRFDLVWSCEFLEHVDERFLDHVLSTLSLADRAVAVTHAFPGQDSGHHHVNLKPTSYWIRNIESIQCSFDPRATREAREVALRDYIRVNHFARSGLVFSGVTPTTARGRRKTWRSVLAGNRINLSFKWSIPYIAHRHRRHAYKRAMRNAVEEYCR